MKEKEKYFIYYNNGYFETTNEMNTTLLHMVETGVIKIIFDINQNKVWKLNPEGIAKDIKVPEVSGL